MQNRRWQSLALAATSTVWRATAQAPGPYLLGSVAVWAAPKTLYYFAENLRHLQDAARRGLVCVLDGDRDHA